MRAVRFTKAEAAAVKAALAVATGVRAASALDKLAAAESPLPTPAASLSIEVAIRAFEGVLGTGNLALPPKGTAQWFGKVGSRIKQIGLTEANCGEIARVVLHQGWNLPAAFETLVWQAPKLLAQAKRLPRPRAAPLAPDGL